MEALFWLSAAAVPYSYFIYPLILLCLPKRGVVVDLHRKAPEQRPRISLIVTAHNEAERIGEKLDNSLAIDYPADRLQILVASDASTDATDEVVRGYAGRGVQLVRSPERLGKEHAQALAVAAVTGEIIVFSDTGTTIPADAFDYLAADFADPRVGAVSSEDRFVSRDGRTVGEGAYVRYEMWLRRLETAVTSLVGLSGSFFAVRPQVCAQWNTRVPSDFNSALNCVRLGLVAVSDPRVVGVYKDVSDPAREYQRKVRTILRGITALAAQPWALNPTRTGLFALQLFSHKIMRWAVPWFAASLLVTSGWLAGSHRFYTLVWWLQVGFYGCVLLAELYPAMRDFAPLRLAYFFVQVNLATAQATLAFLSGKRAVVWNPSRR